MNPARFHLSHTGPYAGVRLCGVARYDGPAIHAGYHGCVETDRICPACLAVWHEATDPGAPTSADVPAAVYRYTIRDLAGRTLTYSGGYSSAPAAINGAAALMQVDRLLARTAASIVADIEPGRHA